jgi:hypothetical protein
MKKERVIEVISYLIPEGDINEVRMMASVRMMVNAYGDISGNDRLDSARWIKNTFCKQLGWELSDDQWGDIVTPRWYDNRDEA